jgi:2-keto-4-pentenoate hydratase/2-oxohepta-3-ene-1,7-dioic acid hydratase in catechol pathway
MAMKSPKWLKNGDIVRIEIEGIGILENAVEENSLQELHERLVNHSHF